MLGRFFISLSDKIYSLTTTFCMPNVNENNVRFNYFLSWPFFLARPDAVNCLQAKVCGPFLFFFFIVLFPTCTSSFCLFSVAKSVRRRTDPATDRPTDRGTKNSVDERLLYTAAMGNSSSSSNSSNSVLFFPPRTIEIATAASVCVRT